jgi:hypothetical protein
MRLARCAAVMCLLAAAWAQFTLAPTAAATSRARSASVESRARERALNAYLHTRHTKGARVGRQRRRDPRASAAVVGGTLSTIEQRPFQVAVLTKFEYEGVKHSFLCGGSVLDTGHVVTAGHCAINPFSETTLPASAFVVVAGASRLTAEEIEKGPTVQARFVTGVRVHPYYAYGAGAGAPDDVAVLALESVLKQSTAVTPIALPASTANPPEGTPATLSGYGLENASEGAEELNGNLYSLGTSLLFPNRCGSETDAVFLCASVPAGTDCNGDSGGPLSSGGTPVLIGVIDTVQLVEGRRCVPGAIDGFVNVAAPEIRDFIEGGEAPPLAPRGKGLSCTYTPVVGDSMTCSPGSWSGGPTFTFLFIDAENHAVYQRGPSASYTFTTANIGRSIVVELEASNSGGTAIVRTTASSLVRPAPPPPPPPQATSAGAAATIPAVGGGQVLGSASASPTSAQIAALLHHVIAALRHAAHAASLRTRGLTVRFTAPEAGTVVIELLQALPAAHGAASARRKPVLVAVAKATFSSAGSARLRIKPTAAGKRMLARAHSLRVLAAAAFTPANGSPVRVRESLTLTH